MAGGDTLKTKAEQRIEQLVNAGRPLTDAESDDLYRALHADYVRKWKKARAEKAERQRRAEVRTLERAVAEMAG